MTRDQGFAIADVASGHFDDEKVRALWRRLGSQPEMCEAVTLHMAVVLASWREGRRVNVDAATPLWLGANPDIVSALVAVGLLDKSQRVPAKTWKEWFGGANARREARREAGRKAGFASGRARANASGTVAEPIVRTSERLVNQTGRQAGPSVPSVSTDPSVPRGRRAQSANGLTKLSDSLPPYEDMVTARKASA